MNPKSFVRAVKIFSGCLVFALAAACTQQAPTEAPVSATEAKTPEQAPKPRAPQTVRVTVPQGTEIRMTLNAPVSSSSSQTGDTFTARTTDPVVVGNRVAIPAGSTIHGQVGDVVPAKKGLKEKEGSISLSFDKVVTPTGYSAPMSAGIASVAPKSTKKTAGIIGGSAAGGALLGKVLGGSTKDAAIGAVVGGAIGTGIAAGTRGKDVDIPAGSSITITLDQPLVITVKP
jgi:hypothetical protein